MARRFGFLLVLIAVTLTAYGAKLLEHIPLQWRPTSQLSTFGTTDTAKVSIQFESFKDARDKPELIAENREDDKPKPVTTADDVGAFVSTHMRELFTKAGLNTVDSNGAVVIKGEVRQFFVSETSTYEGSVAVHLTLVGRDGKTLWSGMASGDAKRFGRSYKAENYYEVLSDSIVNTTSSMLQSAEFQKALAQH